ERVRLAPKVFGSGRIASAIDAVEEVLAGWGYAGHGSGRSIRKVVCEALLLNGSPRLSDVTVEILANLRKGAAPDTRATLHQVHRALAVLGFTAAPEPPAPAQPVTDGVDPCWAEWVLRWEATSTLTLYSRRHARGVLLKVGRWLAAKHSDVREPG